MKKSKEKLAKIKRTPLTKCEKFKQTSSSFKKSPSRGHRNMPWRTTDGIKYPVTVYTKGENGELIFKEIITFD